MPIKSTKDIYQRSTVANTARIQNTIIVNGDKEINCKYLTKKRHGQNNTKQGSALF